MKNRLHEKFAGKKPLDVVASITKIVCLIALIAYCLSLLLPLIWMVYSSFKSSREFDNFPFQLPEVWLFENYVTLVKNLRVKVFTTKGWLEYGIVEMFGYSIVWSVGSSLFNLFLTTVMAYCLAKYDFWYCKLLFSIGMFVMVIPIVGNMPSLMLIRKKLGIYDNMLLTLLTDPACVFAGMNFLILYNVFKKIPWAYAESVFVDGGNNYTAFFRINLPIAVPTCIALFVLDFFAKWNDYTTFLFWLKSYPNLAYGIYIFQNDVASGKIPGVEGMPTVLAGFTLVALPSIILYFTTQKMILTRFNVGGIKG